MKVTLNLDEEEISKLIKNKIEELGLKNSISKDIQTGIYWFSFKNYNIGLADKSSPFSGWSIADSNIEPIVSLVSKDSWENYNFRKRWTSACKFKNELNKLGYKGKDYISLLEFMTYIGD